jgi:hypothetical protein
MSQNDGFDNDMLFTDGMISQDPKVGYRGTAAASASGMASTLGAQSLKFGSTVKRVCA